MLATDSDSKPSSLPSRSSFEGSGLRLPAQPGALLLLDLLLQEPVVDLSAVCDIVNNDRGLRNHVFRLAHRQASGPAVGRIPPLHECIVQIGIDVLRLSLGELPLSAGRFRK